MRGGWWILVLACDCLLSMTEAFTSSKIWAVSYPVISKRAHHHTHTLELHTRVCRGDASHSSARFACASVVSLPPCAFVEHPCGIRSRPEHRLV